MKKYKKPSKSTKKCIEMGGTFTLSVRDYIPKWRKDNDFTTYDPNTPQPFGKSLKRIVIASQYGSESKDSSGDDQTVVDQDVQNPTTFDPSRFQELKIYNQPDINMPGYNPNEEHAFLAPSLRYADVSPRPDAVYALTNGDLNQFTATDINSVSNGHTSVPRVLVSFYDLEKRSYQMQVYEIKKQADENESWPDVKSHKFATIPSTPTAQTLDAQSHIEMKAGEPVIPFYPLGVAIGAAPLKETFGGGIPIGAILTTTQIAECMQLGSHGSTFGGNPLACAVAEQVMMMLSKKSLLNGVKKKEKLFLKKLKDINKEFKCFSAIRSSGLWIGCKLNVSENFNLDTMMKACYAKGLMILKANNNTIRIAPSLIIEDDLILKGLEILRQAIQEQIR